MMCMHGTKSSKQDTAVPRTHIATARYNLHNGTTPAATLPMNKLSLRHLPCDRTGRDCFDQDLRTHDKNIQMYLYIAGDRSMIRVHIALQRSKPQFSACQNLFWLSYEYQSLILAHAMVCYKIITTASGTGGIFHLQQSTLHNTVIL